MAKLHIIPIISELTRSFEIASDYDAAFEYNDFYSPDTLDDRLKVDQLVQLYRNLDRNRSMDTLHGAFLDITVHSNDQLIREVSELRIKQSLDIASRLDCKAVIFHTNFISNFMIPSYIDNWVSCNEEFFRKIMSEYPKLSIYMENMFDTTPLLLQKLAIRMNDCPNFGVCFDIAHAHLSELTFPSWLEALAPYIRHLHMNDNVKLTDSHDAIGQGTIPWKQFSTALTQNHLDPSVLIEVNTIAKLETSLSYLQKHHVYPFLSN